MPCTIPCRPHLVRLRRRWRSLASLALPLPLALAPAACNVKDNHAVKVTPELVPTELYVAPHGLDSNAGTASEPLRSLARAAQMARPGTNVNVLPGVYPGGFRTVVDGLPNARTVFRSTERWKARIVAPRVSSTATAWDNRASYIDIVGFEIDGSAQVAGTGAQWRTGIYSGGSYSRIIGNRVHGIATSLPCTGTGGSGITVDGSAGSVGSDVSGNSVHDIGTPGCRRMQGIHVDAPGKVRNNIVYRVAGAGIDLSDDGQGLVVANNTVVASNTGILVRSAAPRDRVSKQRTRVVNNIVFDNRYGISEQGATDRNNSYRNNLVFGNKGGDWRLAKGMTHSGTVAADPGFMNYTRSGTPDLRLARTSPAIGKGLARDDAGPDFLGKACATAQGMDIGACQHEAPATADKQPVPAQSAPR